MSGHTPGPWKISRGVDGPDNRVIETPDGWGVADAWECASVGEMDANAHLIAAAPDLLAALTELLAAVDQYPEVCPTYEETDRLVRAEEAARAAIKKARGEK